MLVPFASFVRSGAHYARALRLTRLPGSRHGGFEAEQPTGDGGIC